VTLVDGNLNAVTYVPLEEAIGMRGLRLVLTRGAPNPWGLAARAMLEFKNIPYVAAPQEVGEANEVLQRWTGQTSAPVAIFEDERPRTSWADIVLLAERLAPQPSVIPSDLDERVAMFGLCHELCGEEGLGWSARLILMEDSRRAGAVSDAMWRKYGSPVGLDHARARANGVIAMLARRLEAQRALGRWTLVGERISAADFYWTGFSNMLRIFPQDAVVTTARFATFPPILATHLDPVPEILFEHRERVLTDYVRRPMAF